MRPATYNCRITKATGENEAVEITFAAGDADQMAALLDRAGDVLARRTKMHNAKVIEQGEEIRLQVHAAAEEIRDKQLRELRAAGRLIDEKCSRCGLPTDSLIHASHCLKEGNDAESPAGPADVRPDS